MKFHRLVLLLFIIIAFSPTHDAQIMDIVKGFGHHISSFSKLAGKSFTKGKKMIKALEKNSFKQAKQALVKTETEIKNKVGMSHGKKVASKNTKTSSTGLVGANPSSTTEDSVMLGAKVIPYVLSSIQSAFLLLCGLLASPCLCGCLRNFMKDIIAHLRMIFQDCIGRNRYERYKNHPIIGFFINVFHFIFNFLRSVIIDVPVDLVNQFYKNVYVLGFLVIAVIICYFIEVRYVLVASSINTAAIMTQKATNTAFGFVNFAFDVHDLFIPMKNVQLYSAVQTVTILGSALMPPDLLLSFNTTSSSGRRMLQQDGYTNSDLGQAQLFDFNTIAKSLDQVILPAAYTTFALNNFQQLMLQIQLDLLLPFMNIILEVVEIVAAKLECFIYGIPFCGVLEIIQLAFQEIANFGYLIIHPILPFIPPPVITNIACSASELSQVSAQTCAGSPLDLTPPGAYYTSLKSTGTTGGNNGRRLKEEVTRGGGEILINCQQRPDGSYVESIRGEIVHISHQFPCPHLKRALSIETNVLQMYEMEIDMDCFLVCMDGSLLRVCHRVRTFNHTVVHLSDHNCGAGEAEVTPSKRKLLSVFGLTINGFPFSSGGVRREEQEQEQEEQEERKTRRNTATTSTTTTTNREFAQYLRRELPTDRKFEVGSLQCDLKQIDPLNLHDQYMNTICIGGKEFNSKAHQFTRKDFFLKSSKTTRNGRSLEEEEEEDPEQEYQQTAIKIVGSRIGKMVEWFRKTRRDTRLLKSTWSNDGVRRLVEDDHNIVTRKLFGGVNIYGQAYDDTRKAWSKFSNKYFSGPPPEEEEGRGGRRRRRILTNNNQYCGSGQYKCPGNGICVDVSDMNLCPALQKTKDTIWLDTVNQKLFSFSQMKIDPRTMANDAQNCWKQYQTNPATLPFYASTSDQEADGSQAIYCLGMSSPITLRLDSINENGLDIFGAQLFCNDSLSAMFSNSTDANCVCPWYYQSTMTFDLFNMQYLAEDLDIMIMNALIDIQWLFYFCFTSRPYFSWIASIWYGVFNAINVVAGGNLFDSWFVNLLGNFGLPSIPSSIRWKCFVLHMGSFWAFLLILKLIEMTLLSFRKPLRMVRNFFKPKINNDEDDEYAGADILADEDDTAQRVNLLERKIKSLTRQLKDMENKDKYV